MSETPKYGELIPNDGKAPVCCGHPGRVSYVRCQRCNKNICTECQHPAAVGVQCPDCFAQAVQRKQSSAGFKMTRSGKLGINKPFITYTIIAVCGFVFVLQYLFPNLTAEISFIPNFASRQPWRAVTSAFAHDTGSILHILFNMYALWIVGRELETFLGHLRFVVLYVISLLGGVVAVLLLSETLTQTIGASGAIFGLFGALLVVQKAHGGSLAQIGFLVGLNLLIGFTIPNISWQGHVGGLIAGLITATIMIIFSKNPTILWTVLTLLTVAVIIGYYVISAVKGYPINCLKINDKACVRFLEEIGYREDRLFPKNFR